MNFLKSAADWPFLQEPLYRWVIFLIALGFIMGVWASILQYMKG